MMFHGTAIPTLATSARAQQPRHVAAATSGEADTQAARELLAKPVTVTVTPQTLGQTIDAIAAAAGVTIFYRGDALAVKRLSSETIDVRNVPLGEVVTRVLAGTPFCIVPLPGGQLGIVSTTSGSATSGIVTGVVTNVRTKKPIAGALVVLDDARNGVHTGNDGRFHIAGVSIGAHRVTARFVGMQKQVKTITVEDGQTVDMALALEESATALDQVVVTGTVVPTELKAVPNAITVITAKDIEQRGITQLQQLFRGDVPGLFAENRGSSELIDQVVMFSRGATSLDPFVQGTEVAWGTNPIKTYIDGVEMADPKYLSQIDPKSVERIEILTGPQASTIYGSNALNGVMQIFTKRGKTNTPQLTLSFLSGLIENDFHPTYTPHHDYSGEINGIEGRLSYNAGGSWLYTGRWTPSRQTVRTSGYGGARIQLPSTVGSVTGDLSLRINTTRNDSRGNEQNQGDAVLAEQGLISLYGNVGLGSQRTDVMNQQTLGFTLNYAPTSWWSQELGVGRDISDTEDWSPVPVYYFGPGDSSIYIEQSHTGRQSLRYATTLRVPLTSMAQATLTAGGDGWQSVTSSTSVSSYRLSGTLTNSGSYSYIARQPAHNRGGFLQGQLGVLDRLFLTYGLRAEWNPNFGEDAQPNYAPRYGMAYTQDFGAVTAKLRASYGRSTRPPGLTQKQAIPADARFDPTDVYGQYDKRLANPKLLPESQQGGEGGLELYLGERASLVVTRYNQTVNNLIIEIPGVDSVRSPMPNPVFSGGLSCSLFIEFNIPWFCSSMDAQGYAYAEVSQELNVANIRNSGWETQATMTMGPFTTKGTYSWTRSRSLGASGPYRSAITKILQHGYAPQYLPGASFDGVPEHTWALATTYSNARTTVAINISGISRERSPGVDRVYQLHIGAPRLLQDKWNFYGLGVYNSYMPGYATADLNAAHRFSSVIEGIVQVHNLTNYFTHDVGYSNASMGRESNLGFRLHW